MTMGGSAQNNQGSLRSKSHDSRSPQACVDTHGNWERDWGRGYAEVNCYRYSNEQRRQAGRRNDLLGDEAGLRRIQGWGEAMRRRDKRPAIRAVGKRSG